jgi:hypothetical protein
MLSSVSVLFNIIVVAILAPIFEELLFRKLIIDRLAPYGQKSAIIVSALLFGLLHGNLSQFIYALLLGIILGHIYCRTGKIRHTIAIHMGFNALAGVFTSWLVSHIDIEKLSNLQGTEDMMEYVSENLGYILLLLAMTYEIRFRLDGSCIRARLATSCAAFVFGTGLGVGRAVMVATVGQVSYTDTALIYATLAMSLYFGVRVIFYSED